MSSLDWLAWLQYDAREVELRRRTRAGWRSSWYDCTDALSEAIQALPAVEAYTTLNRPAERPVGALKDADVATIKRIVFDLDPVRPKGQPSSDAELAAAVAVRDELVTLLTIHGWSMPALGISGNGAHAVYRCNVMNGPEWREIAASLYAGLRNQLGSTCRDHGVTFDTTVRNPARIWRIYGRQNCKGAASDDRPHRMARIDIPEIGWQPVHANVINRTLDALTPDVDEQARVACEPTARISGSGDYRTLDIVSWFSARNAYRRPLGGGKHSVRCPWEHEHTVHHGERDTSTVLFETHDTMWPNFHCSHAHCEGRGIRDVLALWGDADVFCADAWRVGNE